MGHYGDAYRRRLTKPVAAVGSIADDSNVGLGMGVARLPTVKPAVAKGSPETGLDQLQMSYTDGNAANGVRAGAQAEATIGDAATTVGQRT